MGGGGVHGGKLYLFPICNNYVFQPQYSHLLPYSSLNLQSKVSFLKKSKWIMAAICASLCNLYQQNSTFPSQEQFS